MFDRLAQRSPDDFFKLLGQFSADNEFDIQARGFMNPRPRLGGSGTWGFIGLKPFEMTGEEFLQ